MERRHHTRLQKYSGTPSCLRACNSFFDQATAGREAIQKAALEEDSFIAALNRATSIRHTPVSDPTLRPIPGPSGQAGMSFMENIARSLSSRQREKQ